MVAYVCPQFPCPRARGDSAPGGGDFGLGIQLLSRFIELGVSRPRIQCDDRRAIGNDRLEFLPILVFRRTSQHTTDRASRQIPNGVGASRSRRADTGQLARGLQASAGRSQVLDK